MGQRGPKPGQYRVKFIAASAAKANATGPRFEPAAPKCPGWLSPDAKKVWRERVRELERAGAIAAVDVDLLASYCSEVVNLIAVTKVIDREGVSVTVPVKDRHGVPTGETVTRPHPLLKTRDAILARIRQLADALGIGFASRTRAGSTAPPAPATPNKVAELRERIKAARAAGSTLP